MLPFGRDIDTPIRTAKTNSWQTFCICICDIVLLNFCFSFHFVNAECVTFTERKKEIVTNVNANIKCVNKRKNTTSLLFGTFSLLISECRPFTTPHGSSETAIVNIVYHMSTKKNLFFYCKE